jgi:SH3-like domain-containing protein
VPDPEKGLNFFQACLRISLITLIFFVVAVYKLEIKLAGLFQIQSSQEDALKEASDTNFYMSYKVNVNFADLHDKPNSKTSTILVLLRRGTQVEILEKKGKWSKIRSKSGPKEPPRTGWLYSSYLDSEIQ